MAPTPQLTSGYDGVAFYQEEAGPTTFVKKRLKDVSACRSPTHQGCVKPRDKSGGICHSCQKKVHYSYECRSPALIPRDNAIMYLKNSVDKNTPEDLSDKVSDFHLLNLED